MTAPTTHAATSSTDAANGTIVSALEDLLTVRDFEHAARTGMDPVYYDYVAGGSRDEVTVRANEDGFARLSLLPRVLRGSAQRDLSVELFGARSSMPVLISPTAFHRLVCEEGELATARAAARADTIMIASMASTVAVGEVAAAARAAAPDRDPALWFQLYLQPDLEDTAALVGRASAAGCTALVVTVDSPVLGANERNRRNRFHDLPAGMACENLRNLRGDEPGHVRQIAMSPELSWDHIDWLRDHTGLPFCSRASCIPRTRGSPWSTVSMACCCRITAAASSTPCPRPSTCSPSSSRRSAATSRCCSTAACGAAPTSSRRWLWVLSRWAWAARSSGGSRRRGARAPRASWNFYAMSSTTPSRCAARAPCGPLTRPGAAGPAGGGR